MIICTKLVPACTHLPYLTTYRLTDNFVLLLSCTYVIAWWCSGLIAVTLLYLHFSQLLQAGSLTIEVSPLGEAALKGQETVFEILMEFDPDVNFAYKVRHL